MFLDPPLCSKQLGRLDPWGQRRYRHLGERYLTSKISNQNAMSTVDGCGIIYLSLYDDFM